MSTSSLIRVSWFLGLSLGLVWPAAAKAGENNWTNSTGNYSWDTTSTNWSLATLTWNNANIDDAVFGTTGAGSITVATPITLHGINFTAGGYTIGGSSTLTLASGGSGNLLGVGEIQVAGVTATIGTVIAGTVGLTKTNNGTLILAGVNTYSGATTINAGILQLGPGGLLPSATTLTLVNLAGATFNLNNISQTIASLSGGGPKGGNVTTGTGTGGTLSIKGSTSTSYDGVISGSGGLTLATGNTGRLLLSNASTYTGATTINGGTLQLETGGALPATSALTLANVTGTTFNLSGISQAIASLSGGGTKGGNVSTGTGSTGGTLSIDGTASTVYGGVISGPGGLTLATGNIGTLQLTNSETYTGNTTINGGTLQLGTSGSLPSTTAVTLANVAGATFDLNNQNQTIASLSGGGTTGGNVTTGTGIGGSLTIVSSKATVYGGVISGAGGLTLGSVSAFTSGSVTLNNTNSYTGATNIYYGALVVNGALTGTSQVNLGSNYYDPVELGGNGTINAPVLVYGQSILAPSTTPTGTSTLTIAGNLTINSGTTFNYHFGTAGSPGTSDLINVTGSSNSVTLAGFDTLNITQLSGFGAGTYNLISSNGPLTDNATFTISGGSTGYHYFVAASGSNLVLTVVSTVLLTWSGSSNGAWQNGGPANWNNGTSAVAFANHSNVIFDNTGIAVPNVTVNPSGITAYSIAINNTAGTYTIGGGPIAVDTSISKTLGGSVTFSGSVTSPLTMVSGGTLNVAGTLNTPLLTIATGGTLAGSGTINATSVTLAGAGIINLTSPAIISGTLTSTGGNWNGTGSVSGLVTLSSGAFTIGSGGNLIATAGVHATGGTIAAGGISSILTGSLNYSSGTNSTFQGVIAGSGANLMMNGPGATLTLTNANTYSGITTINAGTLQLGLGGSLLATASLIFANVAGANFDVNNNNQTIASLSGGGTAGGNVTTGTGTGGTLTIVSTAAALYYGGAISGTGGLTLGGNGTTLVLANTHSYSGATNILGGTLLVNGALTSTSQVNVGDSAGTLSGTLGGSGGIAGPVVVNSLGHLAPSALTTGTSQLTIAGNLTIAAGATFDYHFGTAGSPGTSDLVNVTGSSNTVTLNAGTDTLNITQLPGFGIGTYNLLTSAGTLTNNATFIINGNNAFNYAVAATGSNLTLTVSPGSPGAVLTWLGGTSGVWQVGGPTNWSNGSSAVAYAATNSVVFDNNGIAVPTVTVNASGISTNSLTIGNSSGTYTIGGGPIAVTTSISKNQGGSVVFTGAVTTDVTTISGGNFTIGSTSVYTSTAFTTVTGGTLTVAGTFNTPLLNITGGNLALFGNGILNLNIAASIANLTGSAGGTLNLGSSTILTLSPTTNNTYSGAIAGTGGAVSLNGSLSSVTTFSGVSTYSGGTTINAGTLSVANDNSLGAATGAVNIGTFGTLKYTGSTTTARSFGTVGASIGGTLDSGTSTVTLNGATIGNIFLTGPGVSYTITTGFQSPTGTPVPNPGGFSTSPTLGASFNGTITQPNAVILSNSSLDTFTNFNHGGYLAVAAGLGPFGSSSLGVNFTNLSVQGSGAIVVGAGSTIYVNGLSTNGFLQLLPDLTGTYKNPPYFPFGVGGTLVNTGAAGASELKFKAGSVTLIGTPADDVNQTTTVDLHGNNLRVTGGLFINNGYVADYSGLNNGPTGTSPGAGPGFVIADSDSIVKGGGTYYNSPQTQNTLGAPHKPGIVVPANCIGKVTYVNATFGPGGVSNMAFQITDVNGPSGGAPAGSATGTPTSGYSLFNVSQKLTWTATSTNKVTVQLQSLLNNDLVGGPDNAGPVYNFNNTQSYTWPLIKWTTGYLASNPQTSQALNATVNIDSTTAFANVNPLNGGTFSVSLTGNTIGTGPGEIDIVFTPAATPEPATVLGLAAGFVAAGFSLRRRSLFKKAGCAAAG